jgi:DNA-binding LacI/PurR family transcriptional regulator/DNA-binding transcriptional regulator YhcF (GntR family)
MNQAQNPSDSAIQRAFEFVKKGLDDCLWKPGERLPSAKNLAVHARVSIATMIRALAKLKAAGLITTIERGPILAGNISSDDIPKPAVSRLAWQAKRVAMEKDILAGAYAHASALPSFKELQSRYGVCYTTMRKILHSLVDDGVVHLRGKRYEVLAGPNRQAGDRIVFITHQFATMFRFALNSGQYRVIDLIEHECSRRRIKLEIVEIDFFDPAATRRAESGKALSGPAVGYIFDMYWYKSDDYRRMSLFVLERLASRKKPVAILDEMGDFPLPSHLAANPLYQVFCIEGKKAGARMARFLLNLGHQSIAFISAINMPWARQRLEGAVSEFTKAGLEQGVKSIVIDTLQEHVLQILAISGFDDALIRKVLLAGHSESEAKSLFRDLKEYLKTNPQIPFTKDTIAGIRKNLAGIRDIDTRTIDKRFFNRMVNAAMAEAADTLTSQTLSPLFHQTMQYSDVTAWICVNDNTARDALRFLQAENVPVPGKISVVGFDNKPGAALMQRLTTYDFNSIGFTHNVLDFLSRPRHPRGVYRHRIVEVEGIVMQRETAAPL